MTRYHRLLALSAFLLFCINVMADGRFAMRSSNRAISSIAVNRTFSVSSVFSPVSHTNQISGLSISGNITRLSQDYVVRIILKDSEGKEYLVLESYEEIKDHSFSFSQYCEETALLPIITPDSVKVVLHDAILHIDSISVSIPDRSNIGTSTNYSESSRVIRREQSLSIIERINDYNRTNGELWVAGETAISEEPYYIRRMMTGLPDNMASHGIEYYVGGIFRFGEKSQHSVTVNRSSQYVESFDWRNRHGQNWMTPVKRQYYSTCAAYAVAGCLEALTNLYFNRHLDVILSVQELISCSDTVPHIVNEGFIPSALLQYVESNGLCDSTSYPMEGIVPPFYFPPCKRDIITPNHIISIPEYTLIGNDTTVGPNELKNALINRGPLVSGWDGKNGHAMVLVGYNTLHTNDSVYIYDERHNVKVLIKVIEENDSLDGKNYWIFKNSWGANNSSNSDGGYMYLMYSEIVSNNKVYYQGILPPLSINMPMESSIYETNDIIVKDEDGDGFFDWGIGPKPSSCPSWVPELKDGDDTDPTKGYIDSYGIIHEIVDVECYRDIYGDYYYCDGDQYETCNIRIHPGAKVMITRGLYLPGKAKIVLMPNSHLEIDGGVLAHADFDFNPPCKITIKHGGKLILKNNIDFDVPVGCELIVEEGDIDYLKNVK